MVEYRSDYTAIKRTLKKLKKKDIVQFRAVRKKIEQIVEHPESYKPLRKALKGTFRVHIGHFVLLFVIHENEKIVEFINYDHHDKVY